MTEKIVIDPKEIEDFKKANNITELKHPYIDPMSALELQEKIIPPRKVLLSPWLKENQLAMIFAEPGIGKTFFALNCAHALISGEKFLKFNSEKIDSVLYIDSEMDEGELQERWNLASKGKIYPGMKFYTPSMFEGKEVPDISSHRGQKFYDEAIYKHNSKVIFLDSLSFLTDVEENNAREWNFILKWMIKHKNLGRSLVPIHHTNKGNKQYRGSTKLGGLMNSILFLEKCNDEENKLKTARFKLKYDKNRNFFGQEAEEFEAWLDEKGTWHFSDPSLSNPTKVTTAFSHGMSAKEISTEFKISLATVYRYINEAEVAGIFKKRPHGNRKV